MPLSPIDPLALEKAQSCLLQLVSHFCQTHVMLSLVFGGRNLHLLHFRPLEFCRILADYPGSWRFFILEFRALLPARCFWQDECICWCQESALLCEIRPRWARVGDGGIAQSAWSGGRGRREFDSGASSSSRRQLLISVILTLCLSL